MPCHNQQISSTSSSDHSVMKQVRFASNGNGVNLNNISVEEHHSDNEVDAKPNGSEVNGDLHLQLEPQLKLLPLNDQIRELQTIIRDK